MGGQAKIHRPLGPDIVHELCVKKQPSDNVSTRIYRAESFD